MGNIISSLEYKCPVPSKKRDKCDKTPQTHVFSQLLAFETQRLVAEKDLKLRKEILQQGQKVTHWAGRKGFVLLPCYEDEEEELSNLRFWHKQIAKANTPQEKGNAGNALKKALRKCHSMDQLDWTQKIARLFTHGTSDQSNLDRTAEWASNLMLSQNVCELTVLKEVTYNSQEKLTRTPYFCSNTALPPKEAVFRHGTCTSIELCLKVQLPSDPRSMAHKQPNRDTPAKDRSKKANCLFQGDDDEFRAHSQSMKEKQQEFFRTNAPDMRWSCDFCAHKVNLSSAERVTKVDCDANAGQMHPHSCNNWMNSSSYLYAIGFNYWWQMQNNLVVENFFSQSENAKKVKVWDRMMEMNQKKTPPNQLVLNAVANIPQTTIPLRVASVPLAKMLAHEMAFGSIQQESNDEFVPTFNLLEFFNQMLVVLSVFDGENQQQKLYPIPNRVNGKRPPFKTIQGRWKEENLETLATVAKSAYAIPAPLHQILHVSPKDLSLGEPCHVSALIITAESILAKEAPARQVLNAEKDGQGDKKAIGEVQNNMLICAVCFQRMDEYCPEGTQCPQQQWQANGKHGRCSFEDEWSLDRSDQQWNQLFKLHVEKKGSVTVWPNDRAILHHFLMEHCRDATIDMMQQYTSQPLIDQEKCAIQLPYFNLGTIMCDRPMIQTRKIEVFLLKWLKWVTEQANALTVEEEGTTLEMYDLVNKMGIGNTGQSLLSCMRFLEYEGKDLKHDHHQKHMAFWMQERQEEVAKALGDVDEAAKSVNNNDPLDVSNVPQKRKVTGMRTYETSFIGAMQAKVKEAAQRRLEQLDEPSDVASEEEGNGKKMCLNLVSSSFHMMQDALALPSKLTTQSNMKIQKGPLPQWPLLEEAGQQDKKEKYLTNFMNSVDQLDKDILDWGEKMKLYQL